MPRYRLDKDGDRILNADPLATANRRETARRKVAMEADPERYGLSMDTRAVKDRADNREAMARAEAKLELRIAKSRGGIPVPSMRTKTNLDPEGIVLPDPRDKVAEPVEQIPSPDIGLLTPLKMTETVDLSAEQILTTVSRQLDIMSEQIQILKTLVSR